MISKGFFRSTLNFLSSFHNSLFLSRTAHYLKRSKNWNSFIELSSLKFVKNNFHFSHSPGKVFRDHAVFEPAGVHHAAGTRHVGVRGFSADFRARTVSVPPMRSFVPISNFVPPHFLSFSQVVLICIWVFFPSFVAIIFVVCPHIVLSEISVTIIYPRLLNSYPETKKLFSPESESFFLSCT